jgi:hypothetical protein
MEIHFEKNVFSHINVIEFVNGNDQYTIIAITFIFYSWFLNFFLCISEHVKKLFFLQESTEPVPATPVMIFPNPYAIAPQMYYPPMPYAMPQHRPPPRAAPPVQVRPEDVKNIKDMFPDMDEEVIRSVLEASGGNVDAALNHLLSMNEK